MNRLPISYLLLPFCLALPLASAAERSVVTFDTSARVDVDATGRPVKIEAPAHLPPPVRTYIESRLGTWQYSPAMHDGLAQPGTTYVWVGACAIPEGEGYRLALDFKGNGPRHKDGKPYVSPPYPAAAQRRGVGGIFELIVAIAPDGSATPESVTPLQDNERWNDTFRIEIERWARRTRFDPELVNGQAVPSKVRMPVAFSMDPPPPSQLQQEARSKQECLVASGATGALQPVALDSPITVTPSG